MLAQTVSSSHPPLSSAGVLALGARSDPGVPDAGKETDSSLAILCGLRSFELADLCERRRRERESSIAARDANELRRRAEKHNAMWAEKLLSVVPSSSYRNARLCETLSLAAARMHSGSPRCAATYGRPARRRSPC